MFDKVFAFNLLCIISDNLKTILKRTEDIITANDFTSSESGMILLDSVCMKRTCLQINTNNREQNTCEFHRVKK